MSSKRTNAMSQITKYSAQDIAQASSPDDAVAMFLGKPIPSMAPGTQPTVQDVTTKAEVNGEKTEDTETVEGPSILDTTVNAGYDFVRAFYRKGRTKLESTPIPGGIIVPFGILAVLFLVLLPINGHTRLMWLWLALTGNADIGGALVPPTALTAPAGSTGASSYNTGSPSVNPNQSGTSSSKTSTGGTSTSTYNTNQHTVVASTKHNTTVTTNKSKTHSKHKGGGPGPHEASIPDPTAPIVQLSYSYLFRGSNGYE